MAFVLTLVLSLIKLGSGQWQVIGPDKTVQVSVGEDAVFSCFLSPETSAEAMEVRFFKDHVSAVVHLYRDGNDEPYMQLPEYQGRTELVKNFLEDGHVSLRLKKVTLSDVGLYGCWFSSHTHDQEAIWEMQVSAPGSALLISFMDYVGGDIQLLCKSSGWFPEPTVKWKSPKGHDLPSDLKVNTDVHGLFDVETAFIVKENSGIISISIQQNEEKQGVESRVQIAETFFQPSPWRLPSILLGVLCFVLCIGVTGLGIFLYKSQEKNQTELDWRREYKQAEWKEARKHAVEVTLDPDTAHPQLGISDLKAVTYMIFHQSVPYSEKRFWRKCVVASQGFQEGKHYWEVDVGHNKQWGLGICRDDVDRKMYFDILSPKNGHWVLRLGKEHEYFTLSPDRIDLSPRIPPTRVGIFLDYEGGSISFFNINDQSLICTLEHEFEGLLRPYILREAYGATPIFICHVPQRSEEEDPSQRTSRTPNTDNSDSSAQVTTPFLSGSDAQRD
ncbi:butyrophilin-like protein 8 [Talpa occidentalis]|uniref:butyrophilin-like protein 8 n=1 Tax=Talpa occidentalis TaxID=50954 RepID=UPI00188E4AA3|nr:butyrophilin-like protein 8 [Talpa occidentalis]